MKLALLSLPAVALASPLALERRQASAQITSMTASGDGCPPGTYSTLVGVSNTVAEASFDSFGLEAGQNVPVINSDLGCDVSVTVSFPGSCKKALLQTRTQAYVLLALDAGATAKVSTPFTLSGGSGASSPADLSYASQAGANLDVDIDRKWYVDRFFESVCELTDIVGQGRQHHGERLNGNLCCSSQRLPECSHCRVGLQEPDRRIRSGAFAGGFVLSHTGREGSRRAGRTGTWEHVLDEVKIQDDEITKQICLFRAVTRIKPEVCEAESFPSSFRKRQRNLDESIWSQSGVNVKEVFLSNH